MVLAEEIPSVSRKTAPPTNKGMIVFGGDHRGIKGSKSVELCPLGLQFYSTKPMLHCTLLEFNIDLPGRGKARHQVKCTGAVVKCETEKKAEKKGKLYRVWIKFLDIPAAASRRIHSISKHGKTFACSCAETK